MPGKTVVGIIDDNSNSKIDKLSEAFRIASPSNLWRLVTGAGYYHLGFLLCQ
jgi:hypothetical protein